MRILVAKHFFFVGDMTLGNAQNLHDIYLTPTYFNRILMVYGEISRSLTILNNMAWLAESRLMKTTPRFIFSLTCTIVKACSILGCINLKRIFNAYLR